MEPERSTVKPQNTARGGDGLFWRRLELLFDSPALADPYEIVEYMLFRFLK
tara:strand:- start:388 stop:540 length:153 start_codon:yes stop_codon:yes gene_type:complete